METLSMSPPSGRDFEVYRSVQLEEKSTRAAAREFGISQTRVCQILGRVEKFLVAATPVSDEITRARRLELALTIAAARIDFLYRRAREKFECTEGETKVMRAISLPNQPPTLNVLTRPNGGETRYLTVAGQLAITRSKLPAMTFDSLIPYVADDEDEAAAQTAKPCSPPAVERPVASAAKPIQMPVSPSGQDSCAMPSPDAIRPKYAQVAPVQTPIEPPGKPLSPRDHAARKAFLAAT